MIVNKKKAHTLTCVYLTASGVGCIADRCMFWKWVDEKDDLGCCGLIYPNATEEYRVPVENSQNDTR